jgi:hypothetical protein
VGGDVIEMGQIGRSAREALLVAVIGCALLIGFRTANAQIVGTVQYPPASVGEDAQPPPPARMAPQSMSPRRIESGFSGPSERPGYSIPDTRLRASPTPPPTVGGK